MFGSIVCSSIVFGSIVFSGIVSSIVCSNSVGCELAKQLAVWSSILCSIV